jgi:hypothetical protein
MSISRSKDRKITTFIFIIIPSLSRKKGKNGPRGKARRTYKRDLPKKGKS